MHCCWNIALCLGVLSAVALADSGTPWSNSGGLVNTATVWDSPAYTLNNSLVTIGADLTVRDAVITFNGQLNAFTFPAAGSSIDVLFERVVFRPETDLVDRLWFDLESSFSNIVQEIHFVDCVIDVGLLRDDINPSALKLDALDVLLDNTTVKATSLDQFFAEDDGNDADEPDATIISITRSTYTTAATVNVVDVDVIAIDGNTIGISGRTQPGACPVESVTMDEDDDDDDDSDKHEFLEVADRFCALASELGSTVDWYEIAPLALSVTGNGGNTMIESFRATTPFGILSSSRDTEIHNITVNTVEGTDFDDFSIVGDEDNGRYTNFVHKGIALTGGSSPSGESYVTISGVLLPAEGCPYMKFDDVILDITATSVPWYESDDGEGETFLVLDGDAEDGTVVLEHRGDRSEDCVPNSVDILGILLAIFLSICGTLCCCACFFYAIWYVTIRDPTGVHKFAGRGQGQRAPAAGYGGYPRGPYAPAPGSPYPAPGGGYGQSAPPPGAPYGAPPPGAPYGQAAPPPGAPYGAPPPGAPYGGPPPQGAPYGAPPPQGAPYGQGAPPPGAYGGAPGAPPAGPPGGVGFEDPQQDKPNIPPAYDGPVSNPDYSFPEPKDNGPPPDSKYSYQF